MKYSTVSIFEYDIFTHIALTVKKNGLLEAVGLTAEWWADPGSHIHVHVGHEHELRMRN